MINLGIEDSRIAKCDKLLHTLIYSFNSQTHTVLMTPKSSSSSTSSFNENSITELRPLKTLKVHLISGESE
jgi:hypothetical protein